MTEFDWDAYELALAQARTEQGLDLAISFDPQKHPRDAKGRFRSAVAGLRQGDTIQLPDGTFVRHRGAKYEVGIRGDTNRSFETSAEVAANTAFRVSSAPGTEIKHRPRKPVGGPDPFRKRPKRRVARLWDD